jgi:hypothetical protein
MRRGLLLGLLASLSVLGLGQATADAATARNGNLRVIAPREDSFRNYDFLSHNVARNNVDWPVNFVFYNNAEIDKVKSKMNSRMKYSGGAMYGRLNDGNGWLWDEDKGIKTGRCPNPFFSGTTYHMRLYADRPGDRLYNRSWGFYTLGTSHIDHNECWARDRWFGKSEDAEGKIASFAAAVWGSGRVHQDHWQFYNQEPLRQEGNHIWKSNGLATIVKVP